VINAGNLRFASNFKAEWISSDNTRIINVEECEFKTGFVQGLETSSRAAVTICGSLLTGYFEKQSYSYFFEPLNRSSSEHQLVIT